MDIFNKLSPTDVATGTDAGFDVHAVFDVLLKVFGFFRQIIDFLKGIFTPIFEGLFDSIGNKSDDAAEE